MQCDIWKERIIDRLADELSEEESVLLEQHMAECAACRTEEKALRELLAATCREVEQSPDAAAEARLVAEMREVLRSKGRSGAGRDRAGLTRLTGIRGLIRRSMIQVLRPVPIYAVLSLIVVGVAAGFWLGRSSPVGTGSGVGESLHPASAPVAAPSAGRPDPQETGQPGAETAAFAAASAEATFLSGELGFVAAHSDAMRLPGGVAADSL